MCDVKSNPNSFLRVDAHMMAPKSVLIYICQQPNTSYHHTVTAKEGEKKSTKIGASKEYVSLVRAVQTLSCTVYSTDTMEKMGSHC